VSRASRACHRWSRPQVPTREATSQYHGTRSSLTPGAPGASSSVCQRTSRSAVPHLHATRAGGDGEPPPGSAPTFALGTCAMKRAICLLAHRRNASRTGIIPMPTSSDSRPPVSGHEPSGPSLPARAPCPKRRPDVLSRLIDGETVVLDRQAGLVHQLNRTASYIWERFDGQSALTDIAHRLAQVFDVELSVATRDVTAIIRQLEELHLLEWG
jgi:Coenzyme PQQ synthesis protein D (PqqD)